MTTLLFAGPANLGVRPSWVRLLQSPRVLRTVLPWRAQPPGLTPLLLKGEEKLEEKLEDCWPRRSLASQTIRRTPRLDLTLAPVHAFGPYRERHELPHTSSKDSATPAHPELCPRVMCVEC